MSPAKTILKLPPGVTRVKSKGKEYWYYRPNRKAAQQKKEKLFSIKLPGTPETGDFWEKLNELGLIEQQGTEEMNQPKFTRGTFAALIDEYQNDIEFQQLAAKTRKEYKRYHTIILQAWSDIKVFRIKPKHVLALRNKFSETPYKANYLIRTLSTMLSWSIQREYCNDNPCTNIKALKTEGGWDPWTWEHIHYFAEHAQPHIWHVVALCLYTGQRITDVLKMKWTDIRDDILLVKQEKTKKPLFIPIHPELKRIIANIPKISIFVLTNSRKIPWKTGWNAALQKQMDKPEMEPLKKDRLVTHGLRKSACVFLAECGCTDAEIQAITGHSKAMVEYYRKGVDQKKLAKKAILKFSRNSE